MSKRSKVYPKLSRREKIVAKTAFEIGQRTSTCLKNDWEKYIYFLCANAVSQRKRASK